MSNNKLIAGLLIGAVAAIVIGYLMTDSESPIRKKIKESGEGILDFLCDPFDKGKEAVKEYAGEAAEKVAHAKGSATGNA